MDANDQTAMMTHVCCSLPQYHPINLLLTPLRACERARAGVCVCVVCGHFLQRASPPTEEDIEESGLRKGAGRGGR